MRTPELLLSAIVLALVPAALAAETVALDPATLPSRPAFEAAMVSPLALAADGKPLTALLRIPAGKLLPPHGDGEAILTVLSGSLSWGDGDTVDQARERVFGPGSVLRTSGKHWAAARHGEVLAQVVRIAPGTSLTPAVAAAH